MATYCKTCLGAMCDLCVWFDFNGDEDGCYTDNGYCRLHRGSCDPLDSCDSFHCRSAEEGNGFSEIQYGGPSSLKDAKPEVPGATET